VAENLAAMDTFQEQRMHEELIKKLEEESAALTPMLRSSVYMQVIAIGDSIVPQLEASVSGVTVKYYLTLMAIGEMKLSALQEIPEATRLKIYMDALQKEGPHNDWGLAGEYLSGASLDLVRIGKKAIPSLAPLLNDTAAAGIWGSEEATINARYKNRVCDFAYYLILHILDRVEPYAETPAGRDKAIDSLKQTLRELNLMGK
jgi:hypothetical protein